MERVVPLPFWLEAKGAITRCDQGALARAAVRPEGSILLARLVPLRQVSLSK